MTSRISSLLRRAALHFGYQQPEAALIESSRKYWHDANSGTFRSNSHWRGEGGIADEVWLALGRAHLAMFQDFVTLTNTSVPLDRIIEWGSGGGCNAIHFAKLAREFIGVDISKNSLDECQRVLHVSAIDNYVPILIDVAHPEAAVELIPGPCDAFISTYVFEVIPTPEYGRRLLDISNDMLKPGGIAMIQIKYQTLDMGTRSRRFDYHTNLGSMTTYPIDEFWELSERAGFKPRNVVLQPRQPLVNDGRYAYFFMEKRG